MVDSPPNPHGALRPRAVPAARRAAGSAALLVAVLVGGVAVSAVAAVARMPAHVPERPVEEPRSALYQSATAAYRAGRWDQARLGFETLLHEYPEHARSRDYLDRLDTIALESERLTRAEEAMVGGRIAVAAELAASVPPHSPLYAQAEALARASRKSVDQPEAPASGEAGLDLGSVLQEAVALYNAGRFQEAAARAQELAAEAEGEARGELLRWARTCARFGALYAVIPAEGALGGTRLAKATQALAWDRELGGAHGRHLRPRVVEAYQILTEDAWTGGEPDEACARWVEGRNWEPRETEWGAWPARCTGLAAERLKEARGRERSQPRRAAALYTQVTQMMPVQSEAHEAARERLRRLAGRY